jgi:hypothetical protein
LLPRRRITKVASGSWPAAIKARAASTIGVRELLHQAVAQIGIELITVHLAAPHHRLL